MEKPFNMHPSDDQLDLYLLNRLSLEHERLIEEHYFICPECVVRLSAGADFIAVLHAARDESLESTKYIPRKLMARAAALALIIVGTALVCDDPAPIQKLLAKPVPIQGTMPVPRPLEIPRLRRHVQPSIRHDSARRIFQSPPARPGPALAATEMLEIPSDLIIPADWIAEQNSVTAEQLGPGPLPRFEAKPRWLRRVLLAVRKGFEPSRW